MDKRTLILLIIILIIAAFFRLWQLNSIPPGLYPDVAINGNEALTALKTGNFKVFYPENNGREGLFINLISLSFSIFGVKIWSIKIVAAIIGIFTVFGFYLLVKELFAQTPNSRLQATNIALLTSFFLATSFWHTNFSRIGFRAILLPFILVFSFYFLLRGLRRRKILDFIISGIFFGLGFYTYISFRFAVLILLVILIPFWFIYRKEGQSKKILFFVCCFLFSVFITALPIGIYFLKNPQYFISRAAPISIFATENPIKAFSVSLIQHLAMFNFYGDSNWRHNFSGSPMLPWPLGILFLIGIAISFKECISSTKNKNWVLVTDYWLLLSWFFILLLPGILTFEGVPHSLRVIGIIPVVYVFVGLASWKIYQFFEKNTKRKKMLFFACLLFLIAISYSEFNKYFFDWGKSPEVEGAFTKRFAEIGYFLNSLPKEAKKYVIVNEPGVSVPWPDGIPMPAQTIMFIENIKYDSPQSTYLLPEDLDQIKIDKKTVIVPMKYDQNIFGEFSKRFPGGKIEEKEGFFVYKINF
ncbi:glycosyltransferase family 39 protein [Patescibacteria group bacterium]|nr:glycosyltransferase family 39 protein [Patescibacteria group bacterium]